jgi:hypothetical protein
MKALAVKSSSNGVAPGVVGDHPATPLERILVGEEELALVSQQEALDRNRSQL